MNGVNPDIDGDGTPREIHYLPSEYSNSQAVEQARKTLHYQEAYIRKVVDTLNDLNNVIFEVCNEALPDDPTNRWQTHLAEYFKSYEKTKPLQHLIGFTGSGMENRDDPWPDMEKQKIDAVEFVSPREAEIYRSSPPANDGQKIVFADSDHISPFGRDNVWVWKSFTRGLHPQALEAYGVIPENPPNIDYERDRLVRLALGQCLDYANKMDLVSMVPRQDLSSTAFCLANPEKEYLVFSPDGKAFNLATESNLHAFSLEWLSVNTGEITPGMSTNSKTLKPPFDGPAVAYLKRISKD